MCDLCLPFVLLYTTAHGGGWGYSASSVEAVRFSPDTEVLLGGFGLYGGRGTYNAEIKVWRVGGGGGGGGGVGVERMKERDRETERERQKQRECTFYVCISESVCVCVRERERERERVEFCYRNIQKHICIIHVHVYTGV